MDGTIEFSMSAYDAYSDFIDVDVARYPIAPPLLELVTDKQFVHLTGWIKYTLRCPASLPVTLHNCVVAIGSDGSVLFNGQKDAMVSLPSMPANATVLAEVWGRAVAPTNECLVMAMVNTDEVLGLTGAASSTISGCAGDFNDSGSKSVQDLFGFLQQFFAQNGQCAWGLTADINGNGCVSVQDMFDFLSAWFVECAS